MKLLNRTLLGFLGYAVAVLLIVTPVLYYVINGMIIDNVDSTLRVHKREIQSRLEKLPTENDVMKWEDLDGEVFVEPWSGPLVADSIYTVDEEKQRSHGQPGRKRDHKGKHSHNPGSEVYRVLKSTVMIKDKPYLLQAQVSLVESEDLIQALAIIQFLVVIILLAGMLAINWWNSRVIWRPFYNTLDKLKSHQIEKSNSIDLGQSNVKEFNDLNIAIDELTKRDHRAYLIQREFTENASHEMQTPLAIFQSKVELLMQTQPSEEQAKLIESLLDATLRLNRLNKALLLLARIDNRQFPEVEAIDVVKETEDLANHYESEASLKGMKFSIETKETLTVTLNGSLLDILFSNLMVNAMRHGDEKSLINIEIGSRKWIISNQGPPMTIPAEEIFQRFRKGTSNQSSIGLGLAIAMKISHANELKLTYSYSLAHHVFSVEFPESKLSPKLVR